MAARPLISGESLRRTAGTPPALEDVQGLLCYGYGRLPLARFLLLEIIDPDGAKAWLRDLLGMVGEGGWFETAGEALGVPGGPENLRGGFVHTARVYPEGLVGNIAFTWSGLRKLGLQPEWWKGFSESFIQGMHERSHFLGDRGRNDRRHWLWGGNGSEPIHVLLLVYGGDPDPDPVPFESACGLLIQRMQAMGLAVRETFRTRRLARKEDGRQRVFEHFGFLDGIAQPKLPPLGEPEGWLRHHERVFREMSAQHDPEAPGAYSHEVAAGELLLGYPDNWGMQTQAPRPVHDKRRYPMPPDDFGVGGSYLVFRQLEQDPAGLWSWFRGLSDDHGERLWIAAKMMGRWPDGTSAHEHPDGPAGGATDGDGFDYADDPDGLRCPLGAHTRRANPRGGTLSDQPGLAREMSKRHRIIRRGRTYGPPLASDGQVPDLDEILKMSQAKFDALVEDALRERAAEERSRREAALEDRVHTPDPVRGLHFLAFNADIQRQFEFVQKTWVLNPNFGDLANDPDPYLGQAVIDGRRTRFTIPSDPVRRCVDVNRWFVTVKGGGYFFFPSIPALEYLSTAPAEF